MIEPTSQIELSPAEAQRLRAAHYNATLATVLPVHGDLRIFRIVADAGLPPLEAGQFMTLGLGNWEPRVEGVDEEQIEAAHYQRLAKRAYSVSCSVLNDGGLFCLRLGRIPGLHLF